MNLNLEDIDITGLITEYGLRLITAVAILVIGLWLANVIAKGIAKGLDKRGHSPELNGFIKSVLGATLKIAVIISVIGELGIEMTSFVALLGAAGLAVGMALSGTLQNFAGGVMILMIKPYKVGDWVEMQGYSGTVREIQIFHTILMTPDNKKIIIPNAPISNGSLTNYSAEDTRRVDFTFGIGYDDDIDKARKVLLDVLSRDERIFKDPEPVIVVKELADSSVNFSVRVWVNAGDYWPVFWHNTEEVKKNFDKEGVGIPFPQMDVHMQK